jgi:tRNA nucleotidyltransferase (CCA-adding enzyme)
LLRHVSPAFVEDPLRILRVARFMAQLGQFDFSLAEETKALLIQMVEDGMLADLVPERVWLEVQKSLMTDYPSRFFRCLRDIGALERLFPELDRLFEVPQSPVHHPEGNAGVHTLMVVDAAANLGADLDVRFACLVHDLGKGTTHPSYWPRHPEHEQAGLPLIDDWASRLPIPKSCLQLARRVTQWHGWIHKGNLKMPWSDILALLKQTDAFRQPDRFEQLLLACKADHLGRKGFEDQPYPQYDFWLGALSACKEVDTASLAKSGLTGEKMALAIEQQRLARLDNYITRLNLEAET